MTGKLAVRLTRETSGARFAVQSLWARLHLAATPDVRGFHVVAGVRGDAGLDSMAGDRQAQWALARAEGYVLRVTPARVVLVGADEAGLFYGLRTLAQLVEPAGVPQVRINDWPAMKYRGLSVDISRGPVMTEERMHGLVRTLADFKMNVLSFYMEHVFPYRSSPGVAPESGLTAEKLAKVAAYAHEYHVDLIPQQQTFGHLHNMLKLELYADMAETEHGTVLAAENERGYRWVEGAAKELAATFRSPYLHIGSDETFELGEGQSRALVARVGVGEAYLLHMRRVTKMLAPLGKKLMFWGDIALSHPELMPKLPKELVAVTWNYDAKDDFRGFIDPFRRAGMEVWVAPGLNNWSRLYPDMRRAMGNINQFTLDGKRQGAVGMLNTHWNDSGDSLFNVNWQGVLFSAAAAWQEGPVDEARFRGAVDWAFFRSTAPVVSRAVERFERIQALLDASYRVFWADPFSRSGAKAMSAAGGVASEVRRLAEQNLVELDGVEKLLPQHGEVVLYLRLASRQLDYAGMNVQFTRHIAERYREARAAQGDRKRARAALGRISSPNGYLQDLLTAVNEIRPLYREAWLRENSPYWLDNVETRYQAEALSWQERIRLFEGITADFQAGIPLPAPEQVGLYLPE